MLFEITVLAYATAVGFVSSGIAASFYKMLTLQPARFRIFQGGYLASLTSVAFCALTGPMIVMDHAMERRRKDRLAVGWFLAGAGIAALWSCCVGMLVLEFALSVRDSLS